MNRIHISDEGSSGSGYVIHKASRYKALGPEIYRLGDYFRQPAPDLDDELLVTIALGMNQLAQSKGFDELTPLEGIGIEGFYALINVLHFEVSLQALVNQTPKGFLDRMEIKHVITGMPLTLYNLVGT
jgi:hypothetical protein